MSYRALIILSFALVLAACAPQPSASNDPKSRFLRGDPCKPPCFEGIEPGVTTLAEAEQILLASDHVRENSVTTPMFGETPILQWRYADSDWRGHANSGDDGDMATAVQEIYMTSPDLCLLDIIDAYGEPDKFVLMAYQITGFVIVIWDDERMLYQGENGDVPGGPIEGEVCGGTVEFISKAGTYGDFPSLGILSDIPPNPEQWDHDLVDWQGMDYDYPKGDFNLP